MQSKKIIPALFMCSSIALTACVEVQDVSDKIEENKDLISDINDSLNSETGGDASSDNEVENNETENLGSLINVRSVANQSLCMTTTEEQFVDTQNCNNSLAQQWRWSDNQLKPASDDNLCLDAGDGNNYTVPSLKACNDSETQHWEYENQVLSQQSQALDLNRDNNSIILYPYHGFENQQWQYVEAGSVDITGSNEPSNSKVDEIEETNIEDNQVSEVMTDPCPAGSEIIALTPDAGVARMGSVFSRTLYNPNDKSQSNNSHQPQQITIQVTDGANTVSGCEVEWISEGETSNGWVFPDRTTTDAAGKISSWWTAGSAYEQTVYARIKTVDGEVSQTTIKGSAQPHTTRSNSIHINWSSDVWDHFSVDVTPITLPETTYYSTIGFPGGYTGLQTNKVIFSVWDVNGIDAEVIDSGIATCEGFGGEGTGAKCYIPYSPEIGETYRFEVEVSYPRANRTDYTMYFTDMANGDRTRVAQLRYGQSVQPRGAAGFVEDWWQTGQSCLDTEERSAYFHNIKYKRDNNPFTDIRQARGTAVYNQWHNEICANYSFSEEDGKFLWSSGGSEKVGRPQNLANSSSFSSIVSLD